MLSSKLHARSFLISQLYTADISSYCFIVSTSNRISNRPETLAICISPAAATLLEESQSAAMRSTQSGVSRDIRDAMTDAMMNDAACRYCASVTAQPGVTKASRTTYEVDMPP